MKIMFHGLWLMSLCLFTGLFGEGEVIDPSTKEVFPSEVTFDVNGHHYELEATGVATRKKLIIKVYSIASYLQKGVAGTSKDTLAAILSDENAKQLTMKWVRSVGAAQVKESYQEAFHKVFSEEVYGRQQKTIDDFLQFFAAGANKGDTYILRWLPKGYVEVMINGKKIGSVTNQEFALGLWKVWFGDNSVVNRNNLLSRK